MGLLSKKMGGRKKKTLDISKAFRIIRKENAISNSLEKGKKYTNSGSKRRGERKFTNSIEATVLKEGKKKKVKG